MAETRHSHFTGDVEKMLTEAETAFEDYLTSLGYEPAVEVCPVDEGEFFGATDAWDMVADFIGEHPEFEKDEEEVSKHALEIGQVSDMNKRSEEEREMDEARIDTLIDQAPENAAEENHDVT